MAIELRVLGSMQLGPDDAPVPLGGAKRRAVLALLVANYGRAIDADRLADAIWRHDPLPAQPRRTIQVYVSNLRQLLRTCSLDITGTADGYRLTADRTTVDVLAVDDHLATAAAHRHHDHATALTHLRAAEQLWRGRAYLGLVIDELEREAERIETLRVGAVEERLGYEIHSDQRPHAIAELQRLLAEHPYREATAAHLMTGLYLEQRHPEALQAVHALRVRLADIGLEPSPTLAELEFRILHHDIDTTPRIVAPQSVLPTAQAPVAAQLDESSERHESAVRHHLPAPISSLIGRADEVATATSLLSSGTRLVTIVGPGGSGKTRLSLDIAWRLLPTFADDVRVVELVGVQPADDAPTQRRTIASVIAASIGVPLRGRLDPLTELVAALVDRWVLVVLDNCEHLTEVASAARAVLEAGPRVHILATSREPLGVRGESLIRLDGLAVPPAPGEAADEGDYASVQLFVERAKQHAPGWNAGLADGSVARLCHLLDGMPLAIELAAQWVGHFTPGEIAAEIEADLDFLATRSLDVPDRQRSPRAVFDYSWRLLDEAEQQALMRMSVFRGTFDRDAGRDVAKVGMTTLMALVQRSFVRNVGVGRYAMHELLRQLSGERLAASGAEPELRQRHAIYYTSLAEHATSRRAGPQQPHWLARLDDSIDNLRAALAWADDHDDQHLGLHLASALWRYWEIRSHLVEGRRWLDRFVPGAADAGVDPRVLANALYGAGWLSHLLRDFRSADQYLSDGLAVDQAAGRAGRVAWVLTQRAMMARSRGDYRAALVLLEESTAAADRNDDRAGMAAVLFRLAMVTRELGDFTRSVEISRRAIEVYRERGDGSGEGLALLGLADNARDTGDAAELEAHSARALIIGRQLDQPWVTGYALNNLAVAALMRSDHSVALQLASDALTLFRARYEPNGEAEVLVTIGNVHLAARRMDDGRRTLLDGLRLASEIGPYFLVPTAVEDLACAMNDVGIAVHVLAAADTWRAVNGLPQRPVRRPVIDAVLVDARRALGDEDYDDAWKEGTGWSIDRAMSIPSPARVI